MPDFGGEENMLQVLQCFYNSRIVETWILESFTLENKRIEEIN